MVNGSLNLYAYVHNNPTNWLDPLGLFENEVLDLFDEDLTDAELSWLYTSQAKKL
jgi:hypothetical protein